VSDARAPGREVERERRAEAVAARLDAPLTAAGVLVVVIIVADGVTPSTSAWKDVWVVAGWLLWGLFVLEFLVRLVIAPSTAAFLRRNWWQLLFLAVPFLRFMRGLTRSARVARALSGSVRGTRTAARTLGGRIAWLSATTVAVVVAAGQVLFEYGPGLSYGQALHDVAVGAISGEPIGRDGAVVAVLDIALALYAAVFFAALAASVGAFFLHRAVDHDDRRG
jgi:voltage-gated potassium channel